MIRDITLGQYYQTESVIHRLDPRTKLLGTLVYLISLFIFTKPWVFATAAVFLLLVLVLSRVPLKFMLKGLRPIIFILLFTIIVNMFWIKGTGFQPDDFNNHAHAPYQRHGASDETA